MHTHALPCRSQGAETSHPTWILFPTTVQISHLTLTRNLCLLWLTKPLKIWVEDALTAIYSFTFTVPRKWKTRVLCKLVKGISNNTTTTTTAIQEYNLQAAAFIQGGHQDKCCGAVLECFCCLCLFGWWADRPTSTSCGCTWQPKELCKKPRLNSTMGSGRCEWTKAQQVLGGALKTGETSGWQQDTSQSARHDNWIGTWQLSWLTQFLLLLS